jgi:hypothetical protein
MRVAAYVLSVAVYVALITPLQADDFAFAYCSGNYL